MCVCGRRGRSKRGEEGEEGGSVYECVCVCVWIIFRVCWQYFNACALAFVRMMILYPSSSASICAPAACDHILVPTKS